MAITQLNPTGFNYAEMLETLNKTYKSQADITISEYDTTSEPDVLAGSIFANNGVLFENTTDITPTGYLGISNSVTFYLYYDESAVDFIYSETPPTWSDALQGWYNGNDRAFFSMYKDSGGTLYEDKSLLLTQNNLELSNNLTVNGGIDSGNNGTYLRTKILNIGDWNMLNVASISITHGLTFANIRQVTALIRNDDNTQYYDFASYNNSSGATAENGYIFADATNITLSRANNGGFESISFNATSFDRGWIKIDYVS